MTEVLEENHVMIVGVISTFLISLVLTGIIIPKILLIANRKKLFDAQDERKIHKGSIPRLGGMAFVPALIFSVCMVLGMFHSPFCMVQLPEMSSELTRMLCFSLCGLLLLYLVGIADDLVGVRYRAKFAIQLLAAVLLICGGIWINNLHNFCGIWEWPAVCGASLTILVAVFFVNAINMIDGIDGLASGLSTVALVFYGVVFAWRGNVVNALIAFATVGTLVQFFYYNVFGNAKMGKKIFMGDTGALCIGFILTYLSVSISCIDNIATTRFNPIVVAFCPMLVPCFDVLRVFFNRIRAGKSPFLPDRTHIHHKLLRLGMSTPRALMSILFISATFAVVNVVLSQYLSPAILLAADLVVWIAYNRHLSKKIKLYESRSKSIQAS